jgi:hypothetical protein
VGHELQSAGSGYKSSPPEAQQQTARVVYVIVVLPGLEGWRRTVRYDPARVVGVVVVGAFGFFLAACGGSTTPDTEGQTLAQAQQTLRDAGVPEGNITVTGEEGDPNELIVCDHDPDRVAPTEPLTLEVAQSCQDEDEFDRKRKKKRRR